MDKKRHHRIDRCVRKSASVSDQIIDYYYKFGQNRDLEKFLRLRRSSSYNKSSSEGSLSIPDFHENRHIRWSRSLNYLEKRCDNSTESSNSTKNVSTTTEDICNDSNDHNKNKNSSSNTQSKTSSSEYSGEVIESNIQFSSKEEICDKNKKSYSFSCESNIAINIQPQSLQSVSMPNLKMTQTPPKMITEESQTGLDLKVPQENIKPTLPIETETPPNKTTEQKSPESAVKSNKPLEWDSLGDVGYKKTVSKTSISSLERSVLKDFFAEHGIEVTFPVENDKLPQIVEESHTPKTLAESQGAIPKNSNEKWRTTLDSIKEKYLSSSSISLNKTEDISKVPHSTPITLKGDLAMSKSESDVPNKSVKSKQSLESKETQFPSRISSLVFNTKLNSKKDKMIYNSTKSTQYTPTSSSAASSRQHALTDVHRFPKHRSTRSYRSGSGSTDCQSSTSSTQNTKNTGSVTDSIRSSISNDYQSAALKTTDVPGNLGSIDFVHTSSNKSKVLQYCSQKVDVIKSNELAGKQFITSSNLQNSERKKTTDYLPNTENLIEVNHQFVEPNLETIEQKMENLEKYCQTSFIRTQSQEVQVNFSKRSSAQSSVDMDLLTSPSSFEYIANHSENSDKENEKPQERRILSDINLNKSSSTDKNLRNSIQKLFEMQHVDSKNVKKLPKPGEKKSNDLELGVQLLCSLIESKNLNDKQKKSLARKIVMKITKDNNASEFISSISSDNSPSSFSLRSLIDRASIKEENKSNSANSKSSMSGIQTLNSTSENEKFKKPKRSSSVVKSTTDDNQFVTTDSLKEVQPALASLKLTSDEENSFKSGDEQATMREWLDPLTISEKNYDKKKTTPPNSQRSDQQRKVGLTGTSKNKLKDDTETECESNLSWIELEIQRLERLKNKLKAKEQLNNEYDKVIESTRSSCINSYNTVASSQDSSSNREKLSKTPRSSNPSSANNNKDDFKTRITKINVENSIEDVMNPTKDYARYVCRETKDIVVYDKVKPSKMDREKTTKISVLEEKRFPKRRYEFKEQSALENNRSKLETPKSNAECESIKTFAQQRKKEFLDLYENKEHCYDRPAASDHYSEPRECRTKQTLTKDVTYSTTTSSNFCISSESMTIPITANSSTTTTHQYDSRCGIGIQTGDSVLETVPIYGAQVGCGCPKATTRIYKQGKNQVVQVKPKSVAYNITFKTDAIFKSGKNVNNKEKQSRDSSVPENECSSSFKSSYKRQEFEKCQKDLIKSSSTSNNCNTNSNISTPTEYSNVSLTLQEHLRKQRPEFFRNTIERQMVLKKLNCQRQERNEIIRDIIENTSINSIPRKLEQLPPPPIEHTKIFTTKEKKALTKRKYSKLADVQAKVEQENKDRYKKNYRVLTKVFNKKLQRRVHCGQPSLNFSTTVI